VTLPLSIDDNPLEELVDAQANGSGGASDAGDEADEETAAPTTD
jgi:hypothetical protein